MKPKKIYLIRHGESVRNAGEGNYWEVPTHESPLTKLGESQTKPAGSKLKDLLGNQKALVIVSDYTRTRQTFEGIRVSLDPDQIEVKYETLIRERDTKLLSKREETGFEKEVQKRVGEYYFFDGKYMFESGAKVDDRVSLFWMMQQQEFQQPEFPENLVVVGHGFSGRVLLKRMLGESVETFGTWRNLNNCEIVELSLQPNGKYKMETDLIKPELKRETCLLATSGKTRLPGRQSSAPKRSAQGRPQPVL